MGILTSLNLNPFKAFGQKSKKESIRNRMLQTQVRRLRQDVGTWRAALDRAENVYYPDRTQLLNIYSDVVLDLHLSAVMQTRLNNVLGRPFKLQNAAGDEQPQLTKLLRRPWFIKFCTYALEKIYYGHSLIEFPLPENGEFQDCDLVPRQYVSPELGIVRSMPGMITGTAFREDASFTPWLIEVGELTDLGLLNKAATMALYKKNVAGAWADFTEIFGMPFRSIKTEAQGADLDELEDLLKNMGQNSYGVFPDDVEIQFIAAPTANERLYDTFIERANSELSKLVLGQTMTTDNGSSKAQGEVHERVAGSYTRADSEFLAGLINSKLIPFLIQHGYKLQGCEFVWDESEQLSKPELFKIVQGMMQNSGYKLKRDWLASTFGVEFEEEAAPVAAGADGQPAAAEVKPILGYHIEEGVVSRNESRAQLNLPAEDDSKDKARAELKAQLSILAAATSAGLPPQVGLLLAGLDITLPPPADEAAGDEPEPDKPGPAGPGGGGQPAPGAPGEPAVPGKSEGSPAESGSPSATAQLQALYSSPGCCSTHGVAAATAAAAPGDEQELASLWDRLVNVVYAGGTDGALLLDLPLFEYIDKQLQAAVEIAWNAPDPALKKYLKANVQRFSGFKSHKVCQELTRKLVDKEGKIIDFKAFKAEAEAINSVYNVAYLKTEYEQAVASAQMASKWATFAPDDLLQYRTVGDDLVRPEHREYDGVTLPASHAWWRTHYPPNDWNCRCDAVDLVDNDHPITDVATLIELPPVPDLFAHNVGKDGEIFGPEHPYFDVPAKTAKAIDKQLKLNL